MKKKQLVTKVVSMAATASMVATLFPTTAFAVTGDKVAKDGVYKSADLQQEMKSKTKKMIGATMMLMLS